MKEISGIKSWTTAFATVDTAVEDLLVLYDFFREGEVTDEEMGQQYDKTLAAVERLELRNMLRREEDRLGAVLKINAGAGGTGPSRRLRCLPVQQELKGCTCLPP